MGARESFRLLFCLGACVLLAACAETQLVVHAAKSVMDDEADSGQGRVKVGKPYEVAGVWYYPKVQPSYDESGIASWYGEPFHGRKTANGERYNMNALTAAHKTLPMPSKVRVTNLTNGRSLILRVNDRGPFVHGRIIDVSRRAARLLGFKDAGTARVRVTVIEQEHGPGQVPKPETTVAERDALPALPRGTVAAESLPPPQSTRVASSSRKGNSPSLARVASAAPRETILPAPEPPGEVKILAVNPTRLFIQAGAFLRYDNAIRLRARLASLGPAKISTVMVEKQEFFRVRLGPIFDVAQADQMLGTVIAGGIKDARIIVD